MDRQRVKGIILGAVSIILNAVFCVVLRIELFTDEAILPTGREIYHHSAIDRLEKGDSPGFLTLQYFMVVVCVISSLLVIFGVRKKAVRIVQVAAMIVSALIFAFVMLAAGVTNLTY